MDENLISIGSPGYRLLLALWQRRAEEHVAASRLAADAGVREADAHEVLDALVREGLAQLEGAAVVLSERGSEIMASQEGFAYAGLGILLLGMPAKGAASAAGETLGQVTLSLHDGTLMQIIRLLRVTMPAPEHAEYERQRALCALLDLHLSAAMHAIGEDGEEDYDLSDAVRVAQEFGLIPPHQGGSA